METLSNELTVEQLEKLYQDCESIIYAAKNLSHIRVLDDLNLELGRVSLCLKGKEPFKGLMKNDCPNYNKDYFENLIAEKERLRNKYENSKDNSHYYANDEIAYTYTIELKILNAMKLKLGF